MLLLDRLTHPRLGPRHAVTEIDGTRLTVYLEQCERLQEPSRMVTEGIPRYDSGLVR